ncbi:MAG: hypothetical protein IPJ20_18270 [Flammeovirgaceae bacterium]|nr:hypothetical protein [Flammeovirgaceae bacterium]
MENKCFGIMPTSDPDGYAQGHFSRVYQYIIVPACKAAGFSAVRADDPTANDTAMDILKNMIESDMVICDISSKNANALYAFAIRQSINLPVTLIKDVKTSVSFNIQEFDYVEYDDSLRIDTVQMETEVLGNTLMRTFANKAATNSLLSKLDIVSAQPTDTSIPLAQEETKKESHLPVISPLPDYVGDPITQPQEIDKLKAGDSIFHMNYGKGEIASIKKMGKDKMAEFQFESGSKMLMLMTSGVLRKIKVIAINVLGVSVVRGGGPPPPHNLFYDLFW